jgi:hypothetical protein
VVWLLEAGRGAANRSRAPKKCLRRRVPLCERCADPEQLNAATHRPAASKPASFQSFELSEQKLPLFSDFARPIGSVAIRVTRPTPFGSHIDPMKTDQVACTRILPLASGALESSNSGFGLRASFV